MALSAQIRSLSRLGFRAIVVHPLKRLFTPEWNRGRDRFIAHYVSEGAIPLANPDPAFMRCIGCGLCDLECPLSASLDPLNFRGPSVVALAWTRATPELAPVAETLTRLPEACGSCRRCEEVCPTRVPLHELFVWANARLDDTLRAVSGKGTGGEESMIDGEAESGDDSPARDVP